MRRSFHLLTLPRHHIHRVVSNIIRQWPGDGIQPKGIFGGVQNHHGKPRTIFSSNTTDRVAALERERTCFHLTQNTAFIWVGSSTGEPLIHKHLSLVPNTWYDISSLSFACYGHFYGYYGVLAGQHLLYYPLYFFFYGERSFASDFSYPLSLWWGKGL